MDLTEMGLASVRVVALMWGRVRGILGKVVSFLAVRGLTVTSDGGSYASWGYFCRFLFMTTTTIYSNFKDFNKKEIFQAN